MKGHIEISHLLPCSCYNSYYRRLPHGCQKGNVSVFLSICVYIFIYFYTVEPLQSTASAVVQFVSIICHFGFFFFSCVAASQRQLRFERKIHQPSEMICAQPARVRSVIYFFISLFIHFVPPSSSVFGIRLRLCFSNVTVTIYKTQVATERRGKSDLRA